MNLLRGMCFFLALASQLAANVASSRAADSLIESIDVTAPLVAPDDGTYWMQARGAVWPRLDQSGKVEAPSGSPHAMITLQKRDRAGTHMYHGLSVMWSEDLGKTWTEPHALPEVNRIAHDNDLLETPVDMTPQYHPRSGKVLVTGATFWLDLKIQKNIPKGPSDTAYTVYDPVEKTWSHWKKLKMPDDPKFHFARAGCSQWLNLPDGDILLPIYFFRKIPGEVNYVTVVRCGFDGKTLTYKEHGSELTVDLHAKRRRTGLYEPSLAHFGDKYLLTLRADEGAYYSESSDGLNYSEPKPWTFDDGTLLGSYNTQQHWVTHSDGLFLSYTRRGADNDNVFRHRAPIFIAQVDPQRMVVLRETEQIVLPNVGKAFGNFGVCNVTPDETWIVDGLSEADPGKDNLYIAKIRWRKPNQLVTE